MRFEELSKLRSRLYISMLPVVGILTLVGIYFIYNQNNQLNRLDELQSKHYNTSSEIERLLSAVSQIERIAGIRDNPESELINWIHSTSKDTIAKWLETVDQSPAASDDFEEATIITQVQEFVRMSDLFFAGDKKISQQTIVLMAESIGDAALNTIALHNHRIIEINEAFRKQNETQFYVVVAGIVASVLAIGLIAFVMSRKILEPIDSLTQAAINLSNQDWETDFKPTSKDEIGSLEIAFVEMAERIREYKRITSRKMIQVRRRMEACFDRLPHPVLFVDANHRLIYKNPAGARLTNALGDVDAFPPRLQDSIKNVFTTGEHILPTEFDETISIKTENEEEFYLPIVIRIDNESADLVECALLLQNVTALRLSDDLKSDLVATVSHELKTPVTSANMALLLVLERSLGELNEDQVDMLETARSDLERLQRILNHLLQIARIENTDSLTYQEFPIEPLFQHVRDAHRMSAKQSSIEVRISCDDAPLRISADQEALEVALSNFLSNAIKYSPEGSSVELYALKKENKIRLGVIDEGRGLQEGDTNKVFEKFYRSSTRRQISGAGLGLSIVKEIALAHNGTVGYTKQDSRGADFWLEIPCL
jgi:two-component system, NtrC family, sensor histidine kinase KinB